MQINYVGLDKIDIGCTHIHWDKETLYTRDRTCIGYNCKNKPKCDAIIKNINKQKILWFGTQPLAKIVDTPRRVEILTESSFQRMKQFKGIIYAINKREETMKRAEVTKQFIHYISKMRFSTQEAEELYQQVKRFSIVKPLEINVSYMTNNEGAEARIIEKLESLGRNIPKIKVKTRNPEQEAQKAQVKKFIEKREENPLLAKIRELGDNIETITLEE